MMVSEHRESHRIWGCKITITSRDFHSTMMSLHISSKYCRINTVRAAGLLVCLSQTIELTVRHRNALRIADISIFLTIQQFEIPVQGHQSVDSEVWPQKHLGIWEKYKLVTEFSVHSRMNFAQYTDRRTLHIDHNYSRCLFFA